MQHSGRQPEGVVAVSPDYRACRRLGLHTAGVRSTTMACRRTVTVRVFTAGSLPLRHPGI